ncbi:hypothetical protein [Candidatus Proelusimicrobium volucris]|uniref:hypothetical protein n=1 Tax=Candidatus Proelusimicrobium volucris TaxID=3416225 RepID=UPI003D14165B
MKTEQDLISVECFVKNTLDQIRKALEGQYVSQGHIQVSFELGIVATHSKTAKTEGGIGLGVASVLKLGSSGQSAQDKQQTEYNRISFTVPLELDQKTTRVKPVFVGGTF